MLRLKVLGRFELTRDGYEIRISSAKQRAFLCVLVSESPDRVPRDILTEMFWGSRFEAQANASFRQCLSMLRRAIGRKLISSDESGCAIERALIECDLLSFRRLVGQRTPDALAEAVDLYRGEILVGTRINENGFERWLTRERRRVRELAVDAMHGLAITFLGSREYARALDMARCAIELDPHHEEIRRVAMIAFALDGRRANALRHYEAFTDLLRMELDAEPDWETQTLAQRIRSQTGTESLFDYASSFPRPQTDRHETQNKPVDPRKGSVFVASSDSTPPLAEIEALSWRTALPSVAVDKFHAYTTETDLALAAEAFCDDLEIAFSQLHTLRVLAHSLIPSARPSEHSPGKAGQTDGSDYVVKGSVRPRGDIIRINGQLVHRASATNLWASQFECGRQEFEAGSEKIIEALVGTAQTQILLHDGARLGTSEEKPANADQFAMKAWSLVYRMAPDELEEAARLSEVALSLDPRSASAHQSLASALHHRFYLGFSVDPENDLLRARQHIETAIGLREEDEFGYWVLGNIYVDLRETERAIAAYQRSREINPSFSLALASHGTACAWAGLVDEALQHAEQALKNNPNDPSNFLRLNTIAVAHFAAGDLEQAVQYAEETLERKRKFVIPHWIRIASLGQLGDEALQVARMQFLEQFPTIAMSWDALPFTRPQDRDRLSNGLRMALGSEGH